MFRIFFHQHRQKNGKRFVIYLLIIFQVKSDGDCTLTSK